jgi:hypothetical protein
MNAKFVFGPNAGQNIHVPRDQFIDILIRAGVLELGEESAPVRNAPTAARFSVGTLPTTGKAVVKVSDGRTDLFFDGEPKDLPAFKFAVAGGCYAPEEIQRQYAALWNPNSLDDQLESQAEALLQRGYRKQR